MRFRRCSKNACVSLLVLRTKMQQTSLIPLRRKRIVTPHLKLLLSLSPEEWSLTLFKNVFFTFYEKQNINYFIVGAWLADKNCKNEIKLKCVTLRPKKKCIIGLVSASGSHQTVRRQKPLKTNFFKYIFISLKVFPEIELNNPKKISRNLGGGGEEFF